MSTSSPARPSNPRQSHDTPATAVTTHDNSLSPRPSTSEPNEHVARAALQGDSSPRDKRSGRRRRSGGFLLPSAFLDSPPHGPLRSRDPNGGGRKGKQRAVQQPEPRSPEHHHENYADPRAMLDSPESGRGEQVTIDFGAAAPPAIDASEIVNMALSLSEGRRRHLSGSYLSVPQPRSGHRVVSAAAPVSSTYATGTGATLRKHFQDQRRASTNAHGTTSRKVSTSQRPDMSSLMEQSQQFDPRFQTFSAGTEARADKARRYIYQSMMYRRLISSLPPLVPGSHVDSAQGLGRPYNPLQSIRNRKTRVRGRYQLDPDVLAFGDVGAVGAWVEQVEHDSLRHDYVRGDRVKLPEFTSTTESRPVKAPDAAKRRIDWTISPAELLADAYWIEQKDNKELIENASNSRLFPDLTGPAKESRASSESSRAQQWTSRFSVDDAEFDKRAALKRLEPLEPKTSTRAGKLKQVWRRTRRSHSMSSGLSSSDDEIMRKIPTADDSSGYSNPKLVETQSRSAEALSAPKQPSTPISASHDDRSSSRRPSKTDDEDIFADADSVGEGLSSPAPKLPSSPPVPRTREGRASIDDSNPSSPMSFNFGKQSLDLSRAMPGFQSPTQRSKRGLIPFIRSDGNRKRSDTWKTAQAEPDHDNHPTGITSGRQSVDNSNIHYSGTRLPQGQIDVPALKVRPKDARESTDSAVRRFFKGGLIGDLVGRDGSKVFRKKDPTNEERQLIVGSPRRSLEVSDSEGTSGTRSLRESRKNGLRADVANGHRRLNGKTSNEKNRPSIDLPAVKLPESPRDGSRPGTPDRQRPGLWQRKRSDLLSRANSTFSHFTTRSQTHTSVEDHTFGPALPTFQPLGRPGEAPSSPAILAADAVAAGTSKPGHATEDTSRSSSSGTRPRPEPRRQWSISQEHASGAASRGGGGREKTIAVSAADAARLRALLLCSGIKAAELARRQADLPSSTDPGRSVAVETARRLATTLADDAARLHRAARDASSAGPATAAAAALRLRLSSAVDAARGEADAAALLLADVTGPRTMRVRAAAERADAFRRARRRRLRFIRRVAFGGLEWGVLLVMWCAWLVVVVGKAVWGVLRAAVGFGRWALWL
jgi:hypothetical protein